MVIGKSFNIKMFILLNRNFTFASCRLSCYSCTFLRQLPRRRINTCGQKISLKEISVRPLDLVGKNISTTRYNRGLSKTVFSYQSYRLSGSAASSEGTNGKQSWFSHLQEAPKPALYLGFSGLIPFAVPALFCLGSLSYSPLLAVMQVTYGATILSFLGGIHWGYSIDNKASPPNWRNLGYSVTPPLFAWIGLLLVPEFGTLTLMAGLAFAWLKDMKVKSMPAWFRVLRACLSVGAITSLGLMYVLGLLYPPPETSLTYNWVKLIKIIKIILED